MQLPKVYKRMTLIRMKKGIKDLILKGTKIILLYSETNHNWNIGLRAKYDTGASISSIDIGLAKALRLKEVRRTDVRTTMGVENRPIFEAIIKMHGDLYEVNLSGANRGSMKFPMLIGFDIISEIAEEEE